MSESKRDFGSWKTLKFWEKYLAGHKDFSQMDLSGIILHHSIFNNLCLNESDLTGANLERITLSETSFEKARIERANLNRSELSHCDFKQASMRRSSLVGANLEHTDLMGVDFRDADLCHANLMNAKIEGVDFRNANLEQARFSGAIYTKDTRFDDGFDPEAFGMICVGDWTVLEFAERHLYEKNQKLQHRSFRLSQPSHYSLFFC
jgi:uncharacterized protein YjbI with pentapeptide repeats